MQAGPKTARRLALKRVGIENLRLHDLWHTWAGWFRPKCLCRRCRIMGGWKSIDMVQRYARPAPIRLTEYVRHIDEIFRIDVPNLSQSGNLKARG